MSYLRGLHSYQLLFPEIVYCFADIRTQEACTVTQKLDLDQISERSIRTLKDTNITLSFASLPPTPHPRARFVWPTLDDSSDICDIKWRQNVPAISDRHLGYYPILISSQHPKTYLIWSSLLWNIWRRLLTAVRYEWRNGATGFAIPFSVFDPLPTSAFGKSRSTTDQLWLYRWPFFKKNFYFFYTFLLFNQEDAYPCLSPYA